MNDKRGNNIIEVRQKVPNKVKKCLDICYDNMYTIGIVNEKGRNYEV